MVNSINQNESINTTIRKGNYNKNMNYRKVSESVIRTSLHIENVFNHIEDFDLLESKWSDYVVYWVMKKKDNPVQVTMTDGVYIPKITGDTHSKFGRIIVKPSRVRREGYGYVEILYQYEVIDEPMDISSKIPHRLSPFQKYGKTTNNIQTEFFRRFLLSQEEVV